MSPNVFMQLIRHSLHPAKFPLYTPYGRYNCHTTDEQHNYIKFIDFIHSLIMCRRTTKAEQRNSTKNHQAVLTCRGKDFPITS